MNFKRIILSIIVVLACSSGWSQNRPATIKWGEELKEPMGTFLSKIVAIRPDGFYALRRNNDNAINGNPKAFIERYNDRMNLRRSREIELKYSGKQRELEDVIMLGGQLYLLTSFHNQVKKKNYLFRQTIDNNRLTAGRDLDLVGEIDARNLQREGAFNFTISSDSSRLLVHNQLPYQKGEPERFALRVFDEQFQEIWSQNIVLPYNDENFEVESYQIDRNGNVYILGVIYQDNSQRRRRGSPTYQYSILAYKNKGAEIDEYLIDLDNVFITDLTFRADNQGNLVCSGFFSEKGTYSVRGTYFFRVDTETKEIYNQNLRDFDFEFRTEYLSDKEKARAEVAELENDQRKTPELYDFSLDKLIMRSDGGALLVAEQYYVYERYFRDWPYYNMRYDYVYNYNDIIVVNIRPNGEIEWTARIPKKQVTVNDNGYFSSYAMSTVRDKLYFVFNDNGRNFDPDSDRLYNFNGRNSVIALATVDIRGNVDIKPLFSNRDADVITRPKVCRQIGPREMAIYGERGRTYRFASLKFE